MPGFWRVMASGRMEMRVFPEWSWSSCALKEPASMVRVVFLAVPEACVLMRFVSPRNSATNWDCGFR